MDVIPECVLRISKHRESICNLGEKNGFPSRPFGYGIYGLKIAGMTLNYIDNLVLFLTIFIRFFIQFKTDFILSKKSAYVLSFGISTIRTDP